MTAFMIALHPNSIRTMQPGFFLPVFLLCLLLNQNAKATDAECASTASRLDWVNRDSLSPEQLLSLPVGCDGLFIEPADELITATDATESSGEITISGKDSQITKQSTLMTGDVILTQDGRKITGDNAELFNEPQGVTLSGNVSFREKGFLLRGDSASISLEQNTVEVDNAEYVLHQQRVHGEADHMKRDGTGLISLTGGSYSSCSPGDEFWSLRSSSMMLDTANSQGSAKNVRLEILDVPIFYFPYLLFPIGSKRHSGFLAPSISSSEDGLDVTLPYYFNLAPDYDATLIPRHISNRGTQIGGEVRHLSPQFLSSVSATWLPDDKLLNEDRWLLGIRQTSQGIKPWSTHIDIARVSDNDYFDDLDNSGLSVSRATHLQQYGSANYMTDNWLTEQKRFFRLGAFRQDRAVNRHPVAGAWRERIVFFNCHVDSVVRCLNDVLPWLMPVDRRTSR